MAPGSADGPQAAAPGADGAPPGPSLYADVWELRGEDWEVTHRLDSGLELDCAVPSRQSRIHLPGLSVAALQLLRASVHRGATTVDGGKLNLLEVHDLLLAGMADALPPGAAGELKANLARRARAPRGADPAAAPSDAPGGDAQGEAAAAEQPEAGDEAVDISVCEVLGMDEDAAPRIGVARMARPILDRRLSRRVRYVVVLLVPPAARHLSTKLGEALATSFMDEGLAGAVRRLNEDGAEGLVCAFDAYLSAMTILPTIHLPCDAEEAVQLPGSIVADSFLSDKMVDSIEGVLCEERGASLHQPPHQSPLVQAIGRADGDEASFFIEVDEVCGLGRWRMTHRLRQGLELDAGRQSSGAHLPRVSVAALDHVRQILTPATVALDIDVGSAVSAVSEAMLMLRRLQLPQAAVDELERALGDRAGGAGVGNAGDAVSATPCSDVLQPLKDDEACHVLAISSSHIPPTTPMTGVFLRFRSPLMFAFPSTEAPVRFLFVLVGPDQAELSTLADSVAALAIDEDLMRGLNRACSVSDFIKAFDRCLSHLLVIPHTRLKRDSSNVQRRSEVGNGPVASESSLGGTAVDHGHDVGTGTRTLWQKSVSIIQTWQVPLVSGVLLALIWSNADPSSYTSFIDGHCFGEDVQVFGHPLTLHFIVNDIFMVFFFGLAIKEVTEAALPGGSLSPWRNAVNPLMATIGGVAGPAVVYIGLVCTMWALGAFDGWMCAPADAAGASSAHRLRRLGGAVPAAEAGAGLEPCDLPTLIRGWGVPCATDISLAWMFALLIFGLGHPAIDFLLLLAIVDDAIGMIIIATYYSDPANPVEPVWLLLNLAATAVAAALRKLGVSVWWGYIAVAGPISWVGLLKAHVHPALSFVFVVPFIPAHVQSETAHQAFLERVHGTGRDDAAESKGPRTSVETAVMEAAGSLSAAAKVTLYQAFHSYHEAPLHVFEHTLKLPVDCGMFLFGLCNAGVALQNVGHVTTAVLGALVVGKTFGIVGFSLAAVKMGFALPKGLSISALFALSALGGIGLTVALFVANEAFVDPGLMGQAKFAAVLSVSSAGVALLFRMTGRKSFGERDRVEEMRARQMDDGKPEYLDDLLVEEVRRLLWLQRRYKARGVNMKPLALHRSQSRRDLGQIPAEAIEAVIADVDLDTPPKMLRQGSWRGIQKKAPDTVVETST